MNNRSGFIKLDRCLLDKHIFNNEKLLKVWVWCLLRANHKPSKETIGLREIDIQPGEFITGRFKAAEELKMKPSTAWKYLKWLEKNQSIVLKSDNKFTVVSIVNWEFYQMKKYKSNNKMTTKEQQNDTDKNVKNEKEKDHIPYTAIVNYLNEKSGKNYSFKANKTRNLIKARYNEGFTENDFIKVINAKAAAWKGDPKMEKYLRPETLFSGKFDRYLNEASTTERRVKKSY